MTSESLRIADQLRRAFKGEAWHGSSLLDLLDDASPDQAQARPLASAHTIWELILHIDFWLQAALDATRGVRMPKLDGPQGAAPGDWPDPHNDSAVAWFDAQDRLFQDAEKLARAIEQFGDVRLQETVPGRSYDFYHLFHGIVQHSLYHAGQIAMLKKAVSGT
jgi:uncharacterized damage-inducible protein DinB